MSDIDDLRFDRGLYTVTHAARLVGMSGSTLATWAHGGPSGGGPARRRPIVTTLADRSDGLVIPFVGLVEATVVQAFRRSGLPLQRLRRALEVLSSEGELDHPLASRSLYTDGANVLYDYARSAGDDQLRLLTIVTSGQVVFHDVIREYLTRIEFDDDPWAVALDVPALPARVLRIRPDVEHGEPVFVRGGAPLAAVRSRWQAGEPVSSIAADYDIPVDDVTEVLGALWPAAA